MAFDNPHIRTTAPIVLDISRLASRGLIRPFTGVDRVELAYLRHIVGRSEDVFGLVRTRLGFLLIDRAGLQEYIEKLDGLRPWGDEDLLSRLGNPRKPDARPVEADLRRSAIGRCLHRGLARLLGRRVPPEFSYINVGHRNLSVPTFGAVSLNEGATSAVLIHDTIPLDHPHLVRDASVGVFRAKLAAVSGAAHLVIYPSDAAKSAAESWFEEFGRVPPCIIAPLGVELCDRDDSILDQMKLRPRSYFVYVGTIEPRKNHQMLVEVWEKLVDEAKGQDVPQLVFAGSRGWMPQSWFDTLERHPLYGKSIIEGQNLSDAEVASLVQHSAALLFPSLAEGYGLPPQEAAARGVPVICSDLPVLRETLGNFAVYLDPEDHYSWQSIIKQHGSRRWSETAIKPRQVPGWDRHFEIVFGYGAQ